MDTNLPASSHPRVVIIGCGFGGLRLAKALRHAPVQVVVVDRNNYHNFQPLLYQVATGALEADSIAYPIRKIFAGQKNFFYRMADVHRVDSATNTVVTSVGDIRYNYLVLATGSLTNFFGLESIERNAMQIKSIPNALNLRSFIFQNFEKALLTENPDERQALLNIVVVGGGPTGVEISGSLAEMRKHVLPKDYPELDLRTMQIFLVEAGPALLGPMSPASQADAKRYLDEPGREGAAQHVHQAL
ncbi:NAD(P)/FAD-dependent oxidoreductase [Hymenobacter humi]|uniref:NADH:ubiquinone reductase (non-electrogenic) n=1 Tax=Hymenobacter humi TaxID=1411620 RepID=A0ABW2UBX3_9BACT